MSKKISELPDATALNDADLFEVVQGGVSKKISGDRLKPSGLGDRSRQNNGDRLVGDGFIEVAHLAITLVVNSISINTNVHYSEAIAPFIRIAAGMSGYTSPITIDASWYYYSNAFSSGTALVNATSQSLASLNQSAPFVLKTNVNPTTGKISLWIKFPSPVYLPRLTISTLAMGFLDMGATQLANWTITYNDPEPSNNVGTLAIVQTLNTANTIKAADGTIKAL